MLPKIGVRMTIDGKLSHFSWYGRGPHENYPDRKTSADVGLYESTVADQYVPYVRPQETGNKEDVRWAALRDKSGKGLLIVPKNTLSVTVLNFTPDDLDRAGHIHELVPRENIILCLDAEQLGLGNGSCGPGCIEKYRIDAKPVSFGYSLRPVTPKMGDISALARKSLPK
jgi:beta-galactosidase